VDVGVAVGVEEVDRVLAAVLGEVGLVNAESRPLLKVMLE
jgi:hypothetical protein